MPIYRLLRAAWAATFFAVLLPACAGAGSASKPTPTRRAPVIPAEAGIQEHVPADSVTAPANRRRRGSSVSWLSALVDLNRSRRGR